MTLEAKAKQTLGNQLWRLHNLYYITDKQGKKVQFQPNWAQIDLYNNMHYCNVILKARQLGFTTFIQIFLLDQCVFNSHTKAGVIAHNLKDAQAIFNDKIKFAYDNLPEQIKEARPLQRDSAMELALGNHSSIRVGTSMRSGTLQFLHISELGKIAAKYPEKAREIRTGALNTIEAGQVVFIESTAEGQDGDFYRICERAQELKRKQQTLTPLDYKFHFFPWWKEKNYSLNESVPIPDDMKRYFETLADQSISLTPGQKAWYIKKAEIQLEDMKREYPSTPKESFEASVEGAYYGKWMEKAEAQGRIGKHPAHQHYCVHTAWDIGRSDYTSIWFWQQLPQRIRLVGFYQNCGEGLPHYAEELKKIYKENKWSREGARDFVPHDAKVTDWASDKTRLRQMQEHGLNPFVTQSISIENGINAVRTILGICEFDQEACSEGIKVLKNYRKEWDENLSCFKASPRHDWASHGADAFRYLAINADTTKPEAIPVEKPIDAQPTVGSIMDDHFKRMKRLRESA